MGAKELRVGNWVISNGVEMQLTQFGLGLHLTNQNLLDKTEPIPITEEWIVKFGFHYYDGVFSKDGGKLYGFDYDTYWLFDYGQDLWRVNKKPYFFKYKHVHQLQNLYFALTGEELTI